VLKDCPLTKTNWKVNAVDINVVLNELLVKLFRNINAIEERAIKMEHEKDVTTNDMHVMEAIGVGRPKNMTAVAKSLSVTTGTLTIAVNSLVKKGFVSRVRSEEDRRVVLVSLTEKGVIAHEHHRKFHEKMIRDIVANLNPEEQKVLAKALNNINIFFKGITD